MSSLRMRPGVDTIAEIEARLWSPALRKAASPGEKEEGAPVPVPVHFTLKRERWVLLKIPRGDIDEVGEVK